MYVESRNTRSHRRHNSGVAALGACVRAAERPGVTHHPSTLSCVLCVCPAPPSPPPTVPISPPGQGALPGFSSAVLSTQVGQQGCIVAVGFGRGPWHSRVSHQLLKGVTVTTEMWLPNGWAAGPEGAPLGSADRLAAGRAAVHPECHAIVLQPRWRSWRSGSAHGRCTLWHIWPLGWAQGWPRSPETSMWCCHCALPTASSSPRSARCPTPCSATTTRAVRWALGQGGERGSCGAPLHCVPRSL